jgi:hypothetical protein
MSRESRYVELEITAELPKMEIWLGDADGHLVQKGLGVLLSSLLRGGYVVEFGLGELCYPIRLVGTAHLTQKQLEAQPPCSRPIPTLL